MQPQEHSLFCFFNVQLKSETSFIKTSNILHTHKHKHQKYKRVRDLVFSCLRILVTFSFFGLESLFLLLFSTSPLLLCYSTFHSLEIEKVSGSQFVTGWSVRRIVSQPSTTFTLPPLGLSPCLMPPLIPSPIARSSNWNSRCQLITLCWVLLATDVTGF